MNTNALKKFAQEARIKLLDQVGAKLEYVLNTDTTELREKGDQVRNLREELTKTTKEQLIDKVSYTWFNRFMALRFMDANDYQPIGLRVLTPKNGYTLPELLDEAKSGNISEELKVKNQRIYDLLDGKIPSLNAQNEAYKELLIGACNNLNRVFPFLFERINDYTELLLPDDLTSELSIIQDIRDGMAIEDCAEVEIIGWLYQFYISDKKDEVFASKAAVKKEDIPAATQLFTPRWIVEYMVQNTVGKLWLQNKPNSNLRKHMPYFVESPSVVGLEYLKINSVEEVRLLDQACGSGHILVYGFELFYKIYEEEGYSPNEIPELIIKNNLFGFEIDDRASQLAAMALMMKARSFNRRIFKRDINPNILCYKDLSLSNTNTKDTFKNIGLELTDALNHDLTNMQQATNYGSLITPNTQVAVLKNVLLAITNEKTSDAFLKFNLEQLSAAIGQLLMLGQKYHCIVDNPPYMGGAKMNKDLSKWVGQNYPKSKSDLMVCFMERTHEQLHENGFVGMINLPSWMFLSSFEDYRNELIKEYQVDTLLQLGRGIFGSDFGTVAFTFIKRNSQKINGIYRRLFTKHVDVRSVETIKNLFLDKKFGYFETNQNEFIKIPGTPIAYWLSNQMVSIFKKNRPLGHNSIPKFGMSVGDGVKFIRYHFEVELKKVLLNAKNLKDFTIDKCWAPLDKGGEFRRWYGNQYSIVNWANDGQLIRSHAKSAVRSPQFFLKPHFSWTLVSSGTFSSRFFPEGFLLDTASNCLYFKDDETKWQILGFLNSKVANNILSILNPTLNFSCGVISLLPYNSNQRSEICNLVSENVRIAKMDWDSRELSMEVKTNELIRIGGKDLEETYDSYKQYWKNKFFQLHRNEEQLNKQFIEIYGLQDELKPEVSLTDITILREETIVESGQLIFKADEVFKQFISYSVGCMFGRYSLDKEGLIIANQQETLEDYLLKIEKSKMELKFFPDDDNIIPVLDDEWFDGDVTSRFHSFLKVSFGTANFERNLAFVEECLGKDIRKYFVNDFYLDHIKRYKKRPIYWLFSSTKGSFNVLIYLHRYTPDSLNNILNNYLIEYREKLNNRIEQLDHLIISGTSLEQTKAQKEKDRIKLVLIELLEYEREVLRPLAIERINIDLDEGVLVNYNKFGKAIKEVAGLNDKATKKKVREFDWINVEEIR